MQLERKTVDEQLDSFESYIERGGEARASLRPALEQTRTLVERVFQGSEVIDDEKIEQICGHLDGVVKNLRGMGCEKGAIVHIQAIRSHVWLTLKNKNKKNTRIGIRDIKSFDGLIPRDLQKEFEKHVEFSLDAITPRWCQWILDQLGEDSFENIGAHSRKKVLAFLCHNPKLLSLINLIKRKINQNNWLPKGVKLTAANARTVLKHVHEGKSLRESVQVVVQEIEVKEAQLTSIRIPKDLQAEFEKYEEFGLEVITQRWCQWVLDQLGEDSFEGVSVGCYKKVLFFPDHIVRFDSLLGKIFKKNLIKVDGYRKGFSSQYPIQEQFCNMHMKEKA